MRQTSRSRAVELDPAAAIRRDPDIREIAVLLLTDCARRLRDEGIEVKGIADLERLLKLHDAIAPAAAPEEGDLMGLSALPDAEMADLLQACAADARHRAEGGSE
jgi:hypothetical protein